MRVAEKAENTTYSIEVVIHEEEKRVVGKEDKKVCVCRVPKSLIGGHPEAFSPQFVGLGPYHHPRLDLTMTDELKKAAATRIMNHGFKIWVSDLQPFYHKDTLNSYAHDKEKLLNDITIDSFFLLALLNRSPDAQPHHHTYFLTGKHGMPLVNALGVELTIGAVIRDVFMLENQIPTHLLYQINQATTLHGIQSHNLGAKMLRFCKNYCPLAKPQRLPENTKVTHLLDLMYHLVAPMPPETANTPPSPQVDPDDVESEVEPEVYHDPPDTATTDEAAESVEVKVDMPIMTSSKTEPNGCSSLFCSICFKILLFLVIIGVILCSTLWYLLLLIWQIVYGVLRIPCRILYGILKTVLIVFLKLFISLLPVPPEPLMHAYTRKNSMAPDERRKVLMGVQISKNWVDKIRQHLSGDEDKRRKKWMGFQIPKKLDDRIRKYLFGEEDKRPAVTIQSVTELDDAGFHFKPAKRIEDIRFEARKKELFLPVLKLDENSEVIMRNLVAYESLTRDTYLIFTRYVEIMRAIIDTPEDVKVLVQNDIIVTELKDKVVADLFNGMSTSIKPTKVPELEEVIKEVKMKYEESQWLQKIMRYVYSSWKILTAIAAFSFFVLTSVQTFCSVYDCASHFSSNLEKLPTVSDNGLISYI